ncbi:MAG: hypothetical protein JWO41_833 [Candidatus Saccharibacteria bacterium]|nr:hypothetical protein [Candidatus Saccharibacteria bacterium]
MFRVLANQKSHRNFSFTLPEVLSLGKENAIPGGIPLQRGVEVALLAVKRCAELQEAPEEYAPHQMITNADQIGFLNGLVDRLMAREDVLRLGDPAQVAELTEAQEARLQNSASH